MKTLNEHIKKGEYQKVYLIYGEEEYLKKQYRDRMKEAIIGDDTINYSYFEGDGTRAEDVIAMCETMPCFSDRRLVIVSDSSFFKSANDALADYIKKLPDYIVLIFIEKNVDKRNKVYKAVNSAGYVCEMAYQTTAMLKKWIAGMLAKEHFDKLISYCEGKEAVMPEDISAVCSTQTTSRIFEMIEAVAGKNRDKALNLYYDLLELKESPMLILYLIVRQFNGILQAKDCVAKGMSSREAASYIGVQPFIAGKYLSQSKYFTTDMIKEILKECADVEECVKQGRLQDKLGVEMIIIKYSS